MNAFVLFACLAGVKATTGATPCGSACLGQGEGDEEASLLQIHAAADECGPFHKTLHGAPAAMQPYVPKYSCFATKLRNSDFADGSYFITKPGTYVLAEDIVFAPNTPKMFPPKESQEYPSRKGFFLGFFAAIVIATDNVILDLNGHSLSCSYEFTMRQRFFSMIELANLPFNPGAGPPQFAALVEPLTSARNVVIVGGTLGLSSHMGIHGNGNRNIWIHDVTVRDFETGAVQLNNGSNVHLTRANLGPSLGAPGSLHPVPALSTLSQSVNLLRSVEGTAWEQDAPYVALSNAVETFIAQRLAGTAPNPAAPFADPLYFDGLPDGSAVYGVVMHPPGPAVGALSVCPNGLTNDIFSQSHVKIKSLHLSTQEIVALKSSQGRTVAGPAGDVFQILRVKDANNTYQGNVLSDAQLAIGQRAMDNAGLIVTNFTQYFFWFGGTYVPTAVQDWAKGTITYAQMMAALGGGLFCGGDSMAHVNKGVMAERLECVDHMSSSRVSISDLYQQGDRAPGCGKCGGEYFANPLDAYLGNDACGVRVAGTTSSKEHYHMNNITSINGRAIGLNLDVGDGEVSTSEMCHTTVKNLRAVTPGDAHYLVVGEGVTGSQPAPHTMLESRTADPAETAAEQLQDFIFGLLD